MNAGDSDARSRRERTGGDRIGQAVAETGAHRMRSDRALQNALPADGARREEVALRACSPAVANSSGLTALSSSQLHNRNPWR